MVDDVPDAYDHSPMSRRFRWPISRWERLARRLYCATARGLGVMPVIVRAQGARFVVDTVDYIDQGIALNAIWEGPQLEDLAAVCARRPIDYFLDGGANSGFYSVMFAVKNLASRIIAFEPDPGNYAHLLANLHLNRLVGRIAAHALALGDRPGEVVLYEGSPRNRGESTIAVPEQTPQQTRHLVKQVRFDDQYAIRAQTMIIKMDVEGYEFNALAGMSRTLAENACYVQVELYSERLEELKALFAGCGYRYLRSRNIDHYFTNMPDV